MPNNNNLLLQEVTSGHRVTSFSFMEKENILRERGKSPPEASLYVPGKAFLCQMDLNQG